MAGSTITQRIALEGADQIKQALAQIGKSGQEAFQQIQQAGEKIKLDRPLGAVEAAAKRAGVSVDEMRARIANAGGAFGTTGAAAQTLGGQVAGAAAAMSGGERAGIALAGAVIATGSALRSVGSAVAAGAAHFTNLNFGVDAVVGGFRTAAAQVLKTTAVLGAVPATLLALAKSAASTASEIRRNALAAGTSTTAYQEFAAAAGKLGSDQEQLGRAFAVIEQHSGEVQRALVDTQKANDKFFTSGSHSAQEMNQHFQELRDKVTDAGGAFQRYGIAVTEAGGRARDPIKVFKDVADQIAGIPDPADRAARAVELFGRRVGPQLVPLLAKGSAGIERIAKDLHSQGLILTPDQIGVGVEMNRAVGQLQFSVTRLKDSVGLLFAPQFTAAANLFRNAIAANRAAVIAFASDIAAKTRPIVIDLARALSGQDKDIQTGWILTAKAQILELGSAVSTVATKIIFPALKILGGAMQEAADAINSVFGTKVTPADIAVTLVVTKLVGGFLNLLGVLSVFRGAWSIVLRIIAGIGGPLNIMLTGFRALGGVVGIVARGAVALAATFGGLTLSIAAIGFAVGFLAVRVAQGINWQKLVDGAASIGSSVVGIFTALWQTISGLFTAGVGLIAGVWAGIANGAQAVWDTIAAGARGLWDALGSLWQSSIQRIAGFWSAIAAGAVVLWDQLNGLFKAGFDSLAAGWDVVVAAAGAIFDAIAGLAQSVWSGVVSGAQSMWDTITGAFSSGVNAVIGFLSRVRDFALSVWNAITGAATEAAAAQSDAAGAGAEGFARGGPVFGSGSGTSDSIPAWLSNGEFVIRAAAVRKYGLSLFSALNRMRFNPNAFSRFAGGGLVRSLQVLMPPPMRFAEGGLVPQSVSSASLRPINLTIGSELFAGMLAPEDVAQKLLRVAVNGQIRSAGRKPSYYGKGR